ncbi:type I restriction endonuclease [Gracilimonas amylolytica]|uniref:type I restriction endonuclease n=1 Tax=Gracilimonas amylolytica TaxID=1749045 RepID=UPI000CD85B84|nr:type I restriction endonuclease [Gracilimonas amylolytica]
MDLIDQLKSIANNIERQKDKVLTEEATKNAFVMPFIKSLGYDVFNPDEVVPEFTADVGIKKGEKVDYAIFIDGKPAILFECKKFDTNLSEKAPSQLYRYYSVSEAKLGIVTDGRFYHFYSDLEESNKMDDKPYMELDLLNIDEHLIPQLKKISKGTFDLDATLETAVELKYTKAIKREIAKLLEEPTKEFVKFFTSLVYDGRFTSNTEEQFTPIVKKAFNQFIREKINAKIDSAFDEEEDDQELQIDEVSEPDNGVVTTEEEIEGFHIVKAIVSSVVDPKRVVHRDTKSYMGILLDDNNRQPICRLHFNSTNWYLTLFDEEKNGQRVDIESLTDIYKYSEQLKTAATSY